jgi:hypothetical protein
VTASGRWTEEGVVGASTAATSLVAAGQASPSSSQPRRVALWLDRGAQARPVEVEQPRAAKRCAVDGAMGVGRRREREARSERAADVGDRLEPQRRSPARRQRVQQLAQIEVEVVAGGQRGEGGPRRVTGAAA